MKKIIGKIINLTLIVFLISALSISMAGCTSSQNNKESENTSTSTKTYTDMAGRQVELKSDINKIVLLRSMDVYYMSAILGDEFDKKVIALGQSFKDTDIDGYTKYSETFDMDKFQNLGSIYDDAISLESVVNLDPDLIIVDTQFKSKSCVNKMIEAGLPVVFTDMNSDPFHGTQKSMEMIGEMVGKGDKVKKMVDVANQKTDDVLSRVKKSQNNGAKKPKLYFECGNTIPSVIGATRGDTSNGWGYLWDKLGADNIGVKSGSNAMNPEEILTANPDVIVIGGANWDPKANIMRVGYSATQSSISEHLGEYTKRAGWSDLAAIKNKRLYSVHFNYTIYPYNFCGVEAMAKFLYPDEFKDLDPEKDRKDFFDGFMPVKYSGAFSGTWG